MTGRESTLKKKERNTVHSDFFFSYTTSHMEIHITKSFSP